MSHISKEMRGTREQGGERERGREREFVFLQERGEAMKPSIDKRGLSCSAHQRKYR